MPKEAFFLCFLTICFSFINCSSNSTNTDVGSNTLKNFELSWSLVALEDTLIFELGTDSKENHYSFSGLEVFVTNDEFSTLEELVELRDRNGFIVDSQSDWMISTNDSSILFKQIDASSYNEIVINNSIIKSAEFYNNHLLFTTNQNNILRLNPASSTIDTLYQSNQGNQLQIISIIDDYLYIKVGQELTIKDLKNVTSTFENLNLSGRQITKIVDNDTSLLFAGSKRSKVLRSKNNGASWDQVWPDQLPVNTVTDLLYTKSNKLVISILGSGIFYSDDFGDSWVSLSTDELDWNVRAFQIKDKVFIAATNSGIYRSSEISFLK